MVLCFVYLREEIVQALSSLSALHLNEALAIVFRDPDLHLGQMPLFLDGARENFLLSIHVIVVVEVNRLGACGSIAQVLLHLL